MIFKGRRIPGIPMEERPYLAKIRSQSQKSSEFRNIAYAVMNQTLRGANLTQKDGVALKDLSSKLDNKQIGPITIYSNNLDEGNIIEIAIEPLKLADALAMEASEAEAWLSHLQKEVGRHAMPKTSLQYDRVGIRTEDELKALLDSWDILVATRQWCVGRNGASIPLDSEMGDSHSLELSADGDSRASDSAGGREGSPSIDVLERIRVAKAAADAGFDRTPEQEGEWLILCSTAFAGSAGVAVVAKDLYRFVLSDRDVAQRVSQEFDLELSPTVEGRWASGLLKQIVGYECLYLLLARTASIAGALNMSVLNEFLVATTNPPSNTEVLREGVQRVGQDIFRRALIEYWGGRCAVTGLDLVELLRASHIKPWAECESDAERLDVFNGLLLAPHIDAMFDKGWVTFSDDGRLLRSPQLSDRHWALLGIDGAEAQTVPLADSHRGYLTWHRAEVFRRDDVKGMNGQ